ncbi:MAG: 50S ribosomal protein L32 [Candidatus Vogelbacteria bacterium GWA1_51_14]|uniref:Large ribosomal subunit protein bL32 n=1 Tax=Candidatus Vogelbacteria bacterium GWA1_51_14 TaxID=1802435 RepID=A0A1G2Q7X5_9BACT|nr:MAG: 50S ribosomal protein L32 [Candidatus Vogelbacteria bacterium GWA1_51_14]
MVIRMRHTRAHTGNRRSHHGLETPRLSRCAKCGEPHLRHRLCEHCGSYRGQTVIDVTAAVAKKQSKASAQGGSAAGRKSVESETK